MKKELVTVRNIDDFLCRREKKIYVDVKSIILTAGAKDELGKRGIVIINGPCPEAPTCRAHESLAPGNTDQMQDTDFERLFYGVAATLQSEYGINDLELLKSVSLKAAQIIKENV